MRVDTKHNAEAHTFEHMDASNTMSRSPTDRLDKMDKWEPWVEVVAAENMARLREIAECEIKQLRERVRYLKIQQRMAGSFVTSDADDWWRLLSHNEKFEKQYLLKTLQSCRLLPMDIRHDFQQNSRVPAHLKVDRDIFLATIPHMRSPFISIPEALQGDKEVVIRCIKADPGLLRRSQVAGELLRDPDVFKVLLEPDVAPNTKLLYCEDLMQFSLEIRTTPSLMLQALKVLYADATFVAKSLWDDKDFVLAAAKISPPISGRKRNSPEDDATITFFRLASPRLQADLEVATAYCCADGSNLQYASTELRAHCDLIKTACMADPNAFIHAVESSARSALLASREFCWSLLADNQSISNDLRIWLWEKMDRELRSDRTIVAALALSGSIPWSELGRRFKLDRGFWELVLTSDGRIWLEVPRRWQGDIGLGIIAARTCSTSDVAWQRLRSTFGDDAILADRQVVANVVKQMGGADGQSETLLLQRPCQMLLGDKEFVLELCDLDVRIYKYMRPEFEVDRDIVKRMLNKNLYETLLLSALIQRMFPDLIAEALKQHPDRKVRTLIAADLWNNREMVRAWVEHCGEYLATIFADEFRSDEDIFLKVAASCPGDFAFASEALISNKAFMLRAVAINGRLIIHAHESLKDDSELLWNAFYQHPPSSYALTFGHVHNHSRGAYLLTKFAVIVRERLRSYLDFLVVFGGISDATATECSLSLLNQGQETAVGYKRLLCDFAGVPLGEELKKLQTASLVLAQGGY